MELRDWLGPTVSGLAAVFSVCFSVITRFEVRRQQRLQTFALRRQYDADLRAWANSTLITLSDSITLTYSAKSSLDARQFEQRREEVLTRLSTAADAGRWFFPNENTEAKGHGNPTAYRGFRPAILDCVVGAFDELRGLPSGNGKASARDELLKHRREFVSHVQRRLDPRAREEELNALMR